MTDPPQTPPDAYRPRDPDRPAVWSRYLTAALSNPVEVSFGRARRQVIKSSGYWKDPSGAPVELRLAAFFAHAPEEVMDAMARWMRSRSRGGEAGRLLDAFIERGLAATPAPPRRLPWAETAGAAHDLGRLLPLQLGPGAPLHPDELMPLGLPTITWGKRGPSRARRSLQLGSYEEDRHLVRLHRVLDQPAVPDWFVGFVLFHELLHAVRAAEARRAHETDPEAKRGRGHLHHDAAFRERESGHPDHGRAEAWQRRHIAALLRSARSQEPMGSGLVTRAGRALAAGLEQLRLEF